MFHQIYGVVKFLQNPDQLKLKHAWYYMRQQAWASPHALRLLEHANTAREYDVWSHVSACIISKIQV